MSSFKTIWKQFRKYVPLGTIICFVFALIAFIAWLIMPSSRGFSDFLDRTSGVAIRFVMSTITNIFPFSLVEMIVFVSPILVFFLVWFLVRRSKKGKVALVRGISIILAIVFAVFGCFSLGYEASYYRTSIEENVGIERNKLSAENLRDAALILQSKLSEEVENVKYLSSGSSVLPYTFRELSSQLNKDIKTFCEKYPAYSTFYSVAKPLISSEPFTYTHLSGVYSFFTGEANVNVNYPDFIIVTTTAHEMMHQRGVGKEDEADFASFLICIGSDDSYIRYCGYLEIYRQVMGNLYGANGNMWADVRAKEDPMVRGDITAFSKFFDKYRESTAAQITDAVNNAYITSQNQPAGTKSYGLVVDLAVNYLLTVEK